MIGGKTITYIKRDIGYIFWVFVEQASNLALPRLIFFPLIAYILGKEQFGIFMTAFSVVLILGVQPQSGLSIGLLKHLSDYEEEQRNCFIGASLALCRRAMLIIVTVVLLGTFAFGFLDFTSWEVLKCLIPLTISLYPENQFVLMLTDKSFNREFNLRALWFIARSVSMILCGTAGALIGGVTGLSWGILIGNSLVYLCLRTQKSLWFRVQYDKEMVNTLKSVWLQITIAGILTVSRPYLNRLILSFYHSYEEVADLVAASSISFIFLSPAMCCGALIQGMISRYSTHRQFSKRGKAYCLLMLFFAMVVMPLFFLIISDEIIDLIYPKFGEQAKRLLSILIWVIPFGSLICIIRPIVIKFAAIKIAPTINAISFILTLLLAFSMIPSYGSVGASWAIIIGYGVTAMMWMAPAVKYFL